MGDMEAKTLRRYTNVMSALDALANKHIMLTPTSGWADVNDNLSIEQYRAATKSSGVLAVCLTAAFETFHHWQIFAGGQTGVYIELNRDQFVAKVEADPKLLAAPVRYLTLNEIRATNDLPLNEVPFLKRSGFRDEMEYRVIARTDDPECKAMPIKIELTMIEKIVFSPFIPEALVKSTKKIMNSLDGCADIKIGQSLLTTNKQWLGNIDRLLEEAVR